MIKKKIFKKILLPTDGSQWAAQAINAGVYLARDLEAEIVALHVVQPLAATIGFDGMAAAYAITDEEYEKAAAEQSQGYLDHVLERAKTAGVQQVGARSTSNFNVAEGIVEAAVEEHCDLIFIGSHGRSGLSRLLLGSVAAKVVSLSHVAVLVYRVKEEVKE